MAGKIDPNVTVADILGSVLTSKAKVESGQAVEKDEENLAYYAGQMDILNELEALITG